MKHSIIKVLLKNSANLGLGELSNDLNEYELLKVQTRTANNANITALIMYNITKRPIAIVKIPRDINYPLSIINESQNIRKIKDSINNNFVLDRIPTNTVLDEFQKETFFLQKYHHGEKLIKYLNSKSKIKELYPVILNWIYEFYKSLPNKGIQNNIESTKYITYTIKIFSEKYAHLYKSLDSNVLNYLHTCEEYLRKNDLVFIGQHNDFNAHNIILKYNRFTLTDFLIIDWEDFCDNELPIFDINHFFISNSHMLPKKGKTDNFDNYFLSPGFYQDLYFQSIRKIEELGYIKFKTFIQLTPLYFIHMCNLIAKDSRKQENTATVWITRMEKYLLYYKEYFT